MKSLLKSLLTRLSLHGHASRLWLWIQPKFINSARLLTCRNQRLAKRYFSDHPIAKLHIGCGGNRLRGWLNTDLCPRGPEIHLDATKRFPFEDGSFDFIYSEHMIEHVPWPSARHMLEESFRVLKPGGRIRIATPDLAFLTGLLASAPSALQKAYLLHNASTLTPWAPYPGAVFVVNYFVRAWGHQFIFDDESLRKTLELVGFVNVAKWPLLESPHPEFTGLAAVNRMPEGFLDLETMVVEGTKPRL